MSASEHPDDPTIDLSTATEIDRLCDEFERALKEDASPSMADYLVRLEDPSEHRKRLVLELVLLDREHRLRAGESPKAEDYQADSEFSESIRKLFQDSANEELRHAASEDVEGMTIPPSASVKEPTLGERIRYFGGYPPRRSPRNRPDSHGQLSASRPQVDWSITWLFVSLGDAVFHGVIVRQNESPRIEKTA